MNVLIVDDQKTVLDSLKESVKWDDLGVDGLFSALSAAQAKKIAAETEIDILITDIEMPVEDGIKLSKWFSENYPEVPCIFLTAHADFSYAQEAIKNGGFDYILQPVKPDEIRDVVSRCMTYLKEVRNINQLVKKGTSYNETHAKVLENMVRFLFEEESNCIFSQAEWEKEINSNHRYEWYTLLILTVQTTDILRIKKYLGKILPEESLVISTVGNVTGDLYDYWIVICGDGGQPGQKEMSELFQKLFIFLKAEFSGKVMIYAETGNGELAVRATNLKKTKEDNVYLQEGVFLPKQREYKWSLREPSKEEWKLWMLKGDGKLIQNQIQNLLEYAKNENQLTMDYLKKIHALFVDVWIICCYLKNINGREWFDESYSYEKFQQAYKTVYDFNHAVEFIIHKFNQSLKQGMKEAEQMSVSDRIAYVCNYINENLEKTILRSEAAAMTYFSEDYFTKLFKTETGYGFKEYVLKQKMEYCKKLLFETNYPVGVIAGKVGYDNFSNFSQLFKKYTGKTPQEYRNMKV